MPKKPDPYLIDDENPEATEEDFRRMRPASEVLPPALYKKLVANYEARRAAREAVTLHLDPEVAARLRADGPGWEDRAAAMLREAVGL